MRAMELSPRPPLYLVPRPQEHCVQGGIPLPHATVWARLAEPEWNELSELHLQLVAECHHGDLWEWRPVDLSRRPMASQPVGGLERPALLDVPEKAVQSLLEWLARHRVTLARSRELGMTSMPGETRDAFRRRVLAGASEAVRDFPQRELWGREATAAGLSQLADEIEILELPLKHARLLRVVFGLLVIPSALALEEPRSDNLGLMLHGRVRETSGESGGEE